MQESQQGFAAGSRFLITFAAFVIVVAGLKQAESIVSVVLLSVFFAIICTPPFAYMNRKGVPAGLSILLVIVGITLLQLLVVTIVASSATQFKADLPLYQNRLEEITGGIISWLSGHGVSVSDDIVSGYFNPGALMQVAVKMLGGLGNTLSNAFLIILTVIFMLFEAASLPAKLHDAFEGRMSFRRLDLFLDNIKRYLSIKTIVSLITGLTIYIWLWFLGVDFALLWGLLAFLFNFIPNIGSIIAAVPAVLLALVQLGWLSAALTASGFLVVNLIMGNVVEPRYMGKGLGLSTLVVFLSLVFWGWVLGPVGMLLSVPLTMMLKIALEGNQDTRWMAVLLGPEPRDSEES